MIQYHSLSHDEAHVLCSSHVTGVPICYTYASANAVEDSHHLYLVHDNSRVKLPGYGLAETAELSIKGFLLTSAVTD